MQSHSRPTTIQGMIAKLSRITTTEITDEWALVSYDISDNSKRDHFRDKLKAFGALRRTDSVYLFPISVRSFDEIEKFARQLGYLDEVDIATYGARNLTQSRKRTAEYKRDLRERMAVMKERVHLFKEQIFEAEEKLFDESKWDKNEKGEKVPPRFSGWANKISGIRNDQKELTSIVDKYANGSMKTEYEAYWVLFLRLIKRFEKMMEQKHNMEAEVRRN